MPVQFSQPSPGYDWSLTLGGDPEGEEEALRRALRKIRKSGGGRCQLWIQEVAEEHDAWVAELGFRPYRDLWQLRRGLPAPASDLSVRAFRPEDAEAFLETNRRAFAWHPEQGGLDLSGLAADQAQPWYDPSGFLLHKREGRLAGFCWTKIHPDETPPLGEIYAIATDPDFHGLGIGRGLTLAGLAHLHSKGINVGMLYVESINEAANALYKKLGFRLHHVNRAYEAII